MANATGTTERAVQLSLLDPQDGAPGWVQDAWGDGETIEARFWRFHREHPVVYALLRGFAREARAAGMTRIGIRTLWERMRWYVAIDTSDDSGFKLNDHYHAHYARLLMQQEPYLAGLFETRKRRAA